MKRANRVKWHRFYLDLAEFVAKRLSKDPSTKVGAVLVNYESGKEFFGYNGFPEGVKDDPQRYQDRELKYKMIVHAEVNAILKAGEFARGGILYVYPSFALPPICCECVKLAIQMGVKEIIGYEVDPKDEAVTKRWEETIAIARLMCDEAGVLYFSIPKKR